jgi:multidrug efflux system outer membrane protein
VDSYLAVLTAQPALFGAPPSVIQSRQARWSNRVTLYKTLGGGWKEKTQDAAAK